MSRPPIPDWVLRDVLAQVVPTNNVMPITQVLVEMMRADPAVTFVRAEKQLRELGSRVHFLALPSSKRPTDLDVRHPVTGEYTCFYLHVCLHGEAEVESVMDEYGIVDAESNLEALALCGVLTLREN